MKIVQTTSTGSPATGSAGTRRAAMIATLSTASDVTGSQAANHAARQIANALPVGLLKIAENVNRARSAQHFPGERERGGGVAVLECGLGLDQFLMQGREVPGKGWKQGARCGAFEH